MKVALVTGASGDIGGAIALNLSQKGYSIALHYSSSKDKAENVLKKIKEQNGNAFLYQADISNFEQCERMINDIVDNMGAPQVLINNAGRNKDALAVRMSKEDFTSVIDLNLNGTFYCTKCCLPYMIKSRYGRIVNISSVSGVVGNPGQINYSASKAGINGFTRSLAQEIAKRGITVNAIAPGFVDTAMTKKFNKEAKENICSQIAIGRFANPEEIAHVVGFLTDEKSSYITGQIISVDGGGIIIS